MSSDSIKTIRLDYAGHIIAKNGTNQLAIASVVIGCISILITGTLDFAELSQLHKLSAETSNQHRIQKELLAAQQVQMTTGSPSLLIGDAKRIIRYIEFKLFQSNNIGRQQLTAAQRSTLQRVLTCSDQTFYESTAAGNSQFTAERIDEQRRLVIQTDHSIVIGTGKLAVNYGNSISIGPDGTILPSTSSGANVAIRQRLESHVEWLSSQLDGSVAVRFDDTVLIVITITIEVVLAGCLLGIGISAILMDRVESKMLKCYAVMQIPASIAMGLSFVTMVGHSVASMIAPFGIVPGIIGCFYPLVILIVLRRGKRLLFCD